MRTGKELRNVASGQPISAADENAVRDAVRTLMRVLGPGMFSGRGGVLTRPPIRRATTTRFQVQSESNDYVTCRTWDGTNLGADDVLVAKSPGMRGRITGLEAGVDEVYAVYQPDGETGVVDGTGQPLDWIDVSRGGGTSDGLVPVNVTQTGGSAGNASTKCSFTYTVTDLNGTQLGTVMSPVFTVRSSLGAYVAATHGNGYYNAAGAFVLYQVDEVPSVEACS